MFYYSPPKGNCNGHALRPRDPRKAWPKMRDFLKSYFEPANLKDIKLQVNCDATDAEKRATVLFGQPKRDPLGWFWNIKTQDEFQQAVDLILEGYPWTQPEDDPADPILLSFSFYLNWKQSIFPKPDWLDVYATDARLRSMSTIVDLGNKSFTTTHFMFPLSSKEPATYDFLQRFSQEAPFKMNPKHFRVIEFGSNGKLTHQKPDNDVAVRLQKIII